MIQSLAKMKVAGLAAPFGSVPTTEFEVRLQADAYLEAISGATKREITAEGIALTSSAFISGKVSGHDPTKYPGAAEFARAFTEAMDSQFMCLGVSLGESTVKLIEVRRDTPQDEIRKIIEANTPKVLEAPEPRPEVGAKEYAEAGAKLLDKVANGPGVVDKQVSTS